MKNFQSIAPLNYIFFAPHMLYQDFLGVWHVLPEDMNLWNTEAIGWPYNIIMTDGFLLSILRLPTKSEIKM